MHENLIIKHSILFEKYYRVFANSIIKHFKGSKHFNYKTANCRKTIIREKKNQAGVRQPKASCALL